MLLQLIERMVYDKFNCIGQGQGQVTEPLLSTRTHCGILSSVSILALCKQPRMEVM